MSAFLVENEDINRVLHLLDLDGCMTMSGLRRCDEGDELGAKLWALNAAAVACRYRHVPQEMPPFRWSPRQYSLMEMYKAAQVWLYQCSEGEQFTQNLLYVEVREKFQHLAHWLVSELPEYKALPWGNPHNPRLSA